MRQLLAAVHRRLSILSVADQDVLSALKPLLNLDGRHVRSNGVRYYPATKPIDYADIAMAVRKLEALGFEVASDETYLVDGKRGRSVTMRHPDPDRDLGLVTMTTELSCIGISSLVPSVFDI